MITKQYHFKYPQRWSDQFIKANATMFVKQEYPEAKKVKCIVFKRVRAIVNYNGMIPNIVNKDRWGQHLTYQII